MTAAKLIVRQKMDEKLLLKEWKAELLNNLTIKISEIHKVHEEAIKDQREEMKKLREQLRVEIGILGKRI